MLYIGFMLASYSVIANDSVKYFLLPIQKNLNGIILQVQASSLVLCGTLTYGWYINGGDITFGRLNKIPWIEPHGMLVAILLVLTRVYDLSTSFLVLSAFVLCICIRKNVSHLLCFTQVHR